MSAAVLCRGVSVVRGGQRVLSDVDLTVAEGEWVALVGPNGAGKTTLLHALDGLVPAAGSVLVAGQDPSRTNRRRLSRTVALMPQRPVVPEGVTVAELVALGRTPHLGRFAGLSPSSGGGEHHRVVDAAISRLGLVDLAHRDADSLSGGELQRVVLARALAQQPRVLLLDEPTSALDIGHQQSVLDLVETLREQDGITVVAAMHDLTLAAQYATRLVLLDGGRVVADGSPADVLQPDRLAGVYGARVEVLATSAGPVVVPLRALPPP